MIRFEIVEILGLEGKNVFIMIIKVGGEEEEMIMKVFKVKVILLDD